MKKGLLIVFSGPSGVGKGTIREILMKDKSLNLFFSISMTTRLPRNSEKDGVDYYFVSKKNFLSAIKKNELLEYAEFVGHYYGTPLNKVNEKRAKGKNVLLEIETNGALQVLKKLEGDKGLISFFIVPPNLKILKERIVNRKTEKPEIIKERLAKAKKELKLAKHYDYTIVNDDLQKAAKNVASLIKKKIKSFQ